MGLIYLDTNLLVYAVKEHPAFSARVVQAMEAVMLSGRHRLAISSLLQMECLVKPLREGDLGLQNYFEAFFLRFEPLEIPESVYRGAAALRARYGLKTPDALHLACAQHHGCAAIWTHDARLSCASQGLALNVLSS